MKRLLEAGKNLSAIAKELQLTSLQVKSIKNEIIANRINWNNKKPPLYNHHTFILKAIEQGHSVKEIHDKLMGHGVQFGYSTLARTIRNLQNHSSYGKFKVQPGNSAKVIFIPLGKFRRYRETVMSYFFLMQLPYSNYAFATLVKDGGFRSFLSCHNRAFKFFNGMPTSVASACSLAFNLESPELHSKYAHFLFSLGITLNPKSTFGKKNLHAKEARQFKKRILNNCLNKNYKILFKRVKQWINTEVNLSSHPSTGRIVKKEFFLREQAHLLPYKKHLNKSI